MTPPPSRNSRANGPAVRLSCAAILYAGLFALAGAPASADEPGLSVSNAWIRLIIRSRPAAGYFTLSNAGDQARALVGADSPACASLMLHRSLSQGGQDRMEMVESAPVPAHGKLTFAPGGYHLMCMSPTAAAALGHSVPVTLRFSDGGSLTASFAVRGATGK